VGPSRERTTCASASACRALKRSSAALSASAGRCRARPGPPPSNDLRHPDCRPPDRAAGQQLGAGKQAGEQENLGAIIAGLGQDQQLPTQVGIARRLFIEGVLGIHQAPLARARSAMAGLRRQLRGVAILLAAMILRLGELVAAQGQAHSAAGPRLGALGAGDRSLAAATRSGWIGAKTLPQCSKMPAPGLNFV